LVLQVSLYIKKYAFHVIKYVYLPLCSNLNIDDYYFALENVETIANHILSLYGAKVLAYTKNEKQLNINLQKETEDAAVYIHSSEPGVSQVEGPQYEKSIDEKFLDNSTPAEAYRVESYRSTANGGNLTPQLRSYFVTRCEFENPKPTVEQETDITQVADKNFLKKATEYTLKVYSEVMQNALQRTGPVIEMYEVQGSRERRLVIGYRQRSTQGFFSAVSDLYHYYDLYSTRKFVGKCYQKDDGGRVE
jgi:glutamate dehydrogenase